MRILFILTLTSLIRHFESVVLELAERGHSIRIATPGRRTNGPLPEAIAAHPRISQVTCPEARGDEWTKAALNFRFLVDYARYFDAPFEKAEKLRARALLEFVRHLTGRHQRHVIARCPSCEARIQDDDLGRMLLTGKEPGTATFKQILGLLEQSIPTDPSRDAFLKAEHPDVLLVTPLVGLGSEQADWVKSAKALGIPVGFPVFSWDNLTTKGIIHEQPDQIFVWNDIQAREAVELHGVDADAVVVTGGPRFDAFFDLSPKRSRETFCRRFQLDGARPILTYLCSSDFVAGGEVDFVSTWINEIRREPSLAECNILIRPHPRTSTEWDALNVGQWPNVALSKAKIANADQLLYDTLYHSAAVVGLNTSAQIEAGILGKPVYTILAPGFEKGQQGTLHFRYLLREDGGFVELAKDFDAHRRHLADAVAGRYDSQHISDFIERFIRPAGLSTPATPLLVDAIERLAPAKGFSTVKRWLKSASIR